MPGYACPNFGHEVLWKNSGMMNGATKFLMALHKADGIIVSYLVMD